jgi:myo-inositol-1(or 4)-monophosphatase
MENFIKNVSISAGKIIKDGLDGKLEIDVKKDAGWVTDIDKKAEDFIVSEINKAYPDSSILAEEGGETKSSGKMKWIIDPLDGTSNFAHGYPWFCVSIGVEVEGELKFGGIYHPMLNEMFWAEKDKGCYLNDKRVYVSKIETVEDSLLATGFSYLRGEKLHTEVQRFENVQNISLGVRRAGSAALDLSNTACGRFSGFWESSLNPWDVAAGFLMIEEAGGKITSYNGEPTTVYGGDFVVSNGLIHDELLKTIRVD